MARYRDSFEPSPFLMRLNEILGKNFRVGRPFGVELRILWLAAILFPLMVLSSFRGASATEVIAAMVLIPTLLCLIIYTHEMGHIAAGWRYNIPAPLITISPLGGLAHMDAAAPGPRSEIFISLAGPAVHLAWLAVFWPLDYFFGAPLYPDGSWTQFFRFLLGFLVDVNLTLMVFNLLPFYPLDGGRVLRALLSMRMHANRATNITAEIGKVGAVLIGVWGLWQGGVWAGVMIALAISCYIACSQAQKIARWTDGPYGDRRDAWEADADWWKGAQQPGEPSRKSRRRQAKEERRRESEREASAALDAEIDKILERIQSVGLGGLTSAERKTLARASKRRRAE